MFEPKIINNFLSEYDFKNTLKSYSSLSIFEYDEERQRYWCNDQNSQMILYLNTERARQIFKSNTLLPTYAMYARYVGPGAILEKHKDKNACTYTLDLCISSSSPWGLWVDGKEYILKENQALAYMGNDQEHWREKLESKDIVEMVFLHYAEPDHWWFKKGKDNG
jgi:hypothetical protein